MKPYVLRFPEFVTRAVIVDARSFEEALAIVNAPKGTTGNAVFDEIVPQLLAHGLATRFVAPESAR